MSRTRARRRLARALLALLLGVSGISLPVLWLAWQRAELSSPAASQLLLDRHGVYLADIAAEQPGENGYWPLDEVPARVALATLALEDSRFHQHHGVDLLAVLRASWQNLRCRCVHSGASTIAMQVARLQNPRPRTLANKAMEALSAQMLTLRHGREAVLRHYLQLVPYGNGSHGIAHAARWYLDKPAEDLSWAEIAFLSALPHAPHRLNPLRRDGRQRAQQRAQRILDSLHAAELIDPDALDLAQRQLASLTLQPRATRAHHTLHAVLELERQARNAGNAHGVLRSTLDSGSQQLVFEQAQRWLERYHEDAVEQAAVLVVDRRDMAVRALLGSAGYFDSNGGALDFSTLRRSPGSVLKPLIFALALDRQVIAADTILWDRPDDAFGIRNADRQFFGAMLPRQALANSRNVPAAALVRQIGLETTYGFFQQLGLHQDQHPATHYGIGLAIGTLPVTLRDVVTAFSVLINDGQHRELRWQLAAPIPPAKTLLDPSSARLVTQFLADPMVRLPSFARMGALEYPFAVAVKTGTSQDRRDAWTLAYSNEYIVGVWAGHSDSIPMHDSIRGSTVAELAQDILQGLYRLPGAPKALANFPAPAQHRQEALCLATASRDTARCHQVLAEWVPDTSDVLARSPRLAAPDEAALPVDRPITLRIAGARDGTIYYPNPETPADLRVIRLRVNAQPAPDQVVWHVNGRPQAVLGPDDTFHWPMNSGQHRFHVALPYRPERSPEVVIRVL